MVFNILKMTGVALTLLTALTSAAPTARSTQKTFFVLAGDSTTAPQSFPDV